MQAGQEKARNGVGNLTKVFGGGDGKVGHRPNNPLNVFWNLINLALAVLKVRDSARQVARRTTKNYFSFFDCDWSRSTNLSCFRGGRGVMKEIINDGAGRSVLLKEE